MTQVVYKREATDPNREGFGDEKALFENSQGWWFFDETWTDPHGPYSLKEEAVEHMEAYAKTL